MPNEKATNCWEFWNCAHEVRKKCPAFIKKTGQQCWLEVGTFARHPSCPKILNEFKRCEECPWFQKLNPHLAF